MKIYLVGGAIRDKLLNLPVKERDWVVVGSTPEQLLELGYQTVGKDFPVFLHPETKEEYALARTERKVSPGYTGFEFNASPSVTLEEDLLRRDLTINAIAEDETGRLIDPYKGQQDLENKILRHVSPAFSEDPVRLLRVARFAARFPAFQIADETLQLMKIMVKNGEVNALVAERVWQEMIKALQSKAPWRFFEVLIDCKALAIIFPTLQFNTETATALMNAVKLTEDKAVRFAALVSQTNNPKAFCKKLRTPKHYSDLALLTQHCINLTSQLTPETMLTLFEKADAFRRNERFSLLLDALAACKPAFAKEKQRCLIALEQCLSISIENIDPNLKGIEIAHAIRQKRLKLLCSLAK